MPVSATDNTESNAAVSNPNVCKLSEAQKYIAESINNLDRVIGLAENKLDDLEEKRKTFVQAPLLLKKENLTATTLRDIRDIMHDVAP